MDIIDSLFCVRRSACILLAEISLYYSAIFVGGDARFGFVPRRRVPSLRYWYSHYNKLWRL